MFKFDIITVFPKIFDSYFNESIIKRAQALKLVNIKTHDIRAFAENKHKKIDDRPYGGGAGMVLKIEPIVAAVSSILKSKVSPAKVFQKKNLGGQASQKSKVRTKVIILSPKGKQFTQKMAYDWSRRYSQLILISGRYEGIDERAKKILRAEEVSIGPYVMTDGDVGAMAIVSAVARLIPNVINWDSLQDESFFRKVIKEEVETGELEYPHYTRPEIFEYKGKKYRVPKVLLSGDHKKVEEWRKKMRK